MRSPRGAARRRPRSNPEAESFVVLVKRYVHGNEDDKELSRWAPLAVGSDGLVLFDTEAQAVSFASAPQGAVDLSVGDMIVVVPLEYAGELAVADGARWLGVVAPDGVKPAPRAPEKLGGPWLQRWGVRADAMLDSVLNMDRGRLAMAACDCAETVVHVVPEHEASLRDALRAIRSWCRGEGSTRELYHARDDVSSLWYRANREEERWGRQSAEFRAARARADAINATLTALYVVTDPDGWSPHQSARTTLGNVASVGQRLGQRRDDVYASLAPLVERWIPLPVALLEQCTELGEPEAIPFDTSMVPTVPRENPRNGQRHSARHSARHRGRR